MVRGCSFRNLFCIMNRTTGLCELRALIRSSAVRTVVDALRYVVGAEVYLVGGAVRDALLGRVAVDVDLLVRGVARADLEQRLLAHGRVQPIGTRFGVLLFTPRSATGPADHVEVALPRLERSTGRGGYRDVDAAVDQNLPVEADLGRRDFTINAMAYNVAERRLIDPFGAQADLKSQIVRTVGDAGRRFGEDRSRMLRAVRLAAQLGFTIHADTLAAIRARAASLHETIDGERVVPNETIGREVVLALCAAPRHTIELLDETGLLTHILPELEACRGIEQYPAFHPEGDVYTHTLDVLGRLPNKATPNLIVAALCHDLGKAISLQANSVTIENPHAYFTSGAYDPTTTKIQNIGHQETSEIIARALFNRLVLTQFARDAHHPLDRDEVLYTVRHHLLLNIGAMSIAKAERILFAPDGSQHTTLLELARLDPTPPLRGEYLHAVARVQEITRARGAAALKAKAPAALLTGHELLAAGYQPGPVIGQALRAVREAQLKNQVTDTDSALAWVRERFGSQQVTSRR